jgi:hypothetical protein
MKNLYLIAFSLFTAVLFQPSMSFAQGGCIEIKSILVDACGSPEGENEMVRFDVGPNDLNVANMNVDWPNNPWLGLTQDASTAAIVTSINQIIQGCGSVSEPVNGVLPANSKVLLVTSTNINTQFNSFANLNDNLIILFQTAGNTSGHFANYNVAPGLRTLIVEFTGACNDTVTYDRTLLINQFGVIGGFSFENDGAFVEFDATGNPTYLNYGCQVLSTGLSLTGGPDVGICPGTTGNASLNGSAVNLIGNVTWAGGTGTFNPPNSLNTVYTPGPGETGLVILTVTGNGACNSSVTDTVRVNIVTSMPSVSLSLSVDGIISSSFTDPGYFYNWWLVGSTSAIPFQFNPTYTPNNNGCYYLVLSTIGGCTSVSDTVCITNVGLPEPVYNNSMTIVNNPGSSPVLQLNMVAPAGNMNIDIIDAAGRLVRSSKYNVQSEYSLIIPDWSNLAPGVYFVRASNYQYFFEGKAILLQE